MLDWGTYFDHCQDMCVDGCNKFRTVMCIVVWGGECGVPARGARCAADGASVWYNWPTFFRMLCQCIVCVCVCVYATETKDWGIFVRYLRLTPTRNATRRTFRFARLRHLRNYPTVVDEIWQLSWALQVVSAISFEFCQIGSILCQQLKSISTPSIQLYPYHKV